MIDMKKKYIVIIIIGIIVIALVSILIILNVKNKDNKGNNTTTTTTTATTVTTTTANLNGKIKITFDSNGGSNVEPMIVNKDEEVTLPVPTKEGYVFAYWENADGEIFYDEESFEENTSLKAVWTENNDGNGNYRLIMY